MTDLVTPEGDAGRRATFGASLALAGIMVTALTVGGKLAAFAHDVVLSQLFGATEASDAFFIANFIPGILWTAFFATINVVFLPIYIRGLARSAEEGRKLASEGAITYATLGVVVGAVCALSAETIVRWSAPESSATTQELARQLTVMMAAGFAFSGYVAVQNAIQQANGHYLSPLSIPLINNLIAISGLFTAALFQDLRIGVAAMVLAWVVQAPIQRLQTRAYYSTTRLAVRSHTIRSLTLLSVPVLLGTFIDQVNIFVGLHLASNFGEGAISHLNYASRLALFLATTFSILVSYFLFPRLSSEASTGNDSGSATTLELGLLLIVGATLPLAAVTFLLSGDIVRLVYGHGALSEDDLVRTAGALGFFVIGAVFIAVRELLNRLFFSQQRNVAPMAAGAVAVTANVVISSWASARMGLNGVALGASLSAVLYCVCQVALIRFWKPGLLRARNLVNLGWILGACLVALGATQLLLPALAGWPLLARLLLAALVYGLAFAVGVAPLLHLRRHLLLRNSYQEGS